MKIHILLLSTIFVLCGCSNSLKQATPIEGSDEWIEWVGNQVQSDDGEGHGPDWGGNEWCGVIEFRLFNRQSGLEPCSLAWQKKVTQALLEKQSSKK